jgi:hypothetical protein
MDTFEDLQQKILLTTTTDKNVSLTLDGLNINYDLDTIPKNFAMGSAGVSWTDGTLNFNTGLGRLASIQEAFQAVVLPPNAFTLKLNDSLLLTDGITDSAVHSKTQSLITDGTATSTITKDTLTMEYIDTGVSTANISSTVNSTGTNLTSQISTSSYQTNFNGASSSSGSSVGANYETLSGSIITNNGAINVNGGGSEVLISSINISGASSQFLRLETPLSGDALIEHNNPSGGRNLGISSTGNLLITANNMSSTATNLTVKSSSTGNITAPLLTLTNTNTNGSVAMECFKNKPTASVNGDVLFTQSVFGKDSGNAKQEFTRINHTVRDTTAGVEDGSIEFGCFVNGAINTFLQINGNENEINALKNIDLGGNAIRTSTGSMTITTAPSSGTGLLELNAKSDLQLLSAGGEIIVSTASSTGSGDIDITGKSGSITTISATQINLNATNNNVNLNAGVDINAITIAGDVFITSNNTAPSVTSGVNLTSTTQQITMNMGTDFVLNGANIQSSTASGNSGQHLRIKLNGVYYKIKLEND